MGFWQTVVATVLGGSILLVVGMVLGAFSESVKARVRRWSSSPRRWYEQVRGWRRNREQGKQDACIEKCANSDGGHDLYVKPFQDHDKGTTIRCFKACGYEELCTHRDKDGLLAEMPLMYSGYVFTYSYKHQTSFPSLGVCRQCMKILGNWGVCILCGEKRTLVTLGVESREWRQKYFELVQEKIRAWWLPLCADDIGCEKRTAKDEFVRVRERVGKWVREQEE